MNSVALPVGNAHIAIYNFILFFLLVVTMVKNYINRKPIIYYNKNYYSFYAFYLSLIISSLIACMTLPSSWYVNSVTVTIKFVVLTGGLVLLLPLETVREHTCVFLKGFYYSAYVQLIWGVFQLIIWYSIGINLNVVVFEEFLKIGGGEVNWNANIMGGIVCRMSGLSWETANFALVMIVGYILATKKWEKLIFLIAILASTSRTGMLTLGMLVLVQMLIQMYQKKIIIKITVKDLFRVFVIVLVATLIILKFEEAIIVIIDNIERTFDGLILGITTMDNHSANVHKLYYLKLTDLLDDSTWYNILFGYGSFSAGYPYEMFRIVIHGLETWNPESDIITVFIGNGIVGALLYYYIIVKSIITAKNNVSIYIAFSIAIAGITYLYIRGTWSFILLIFLINYKNNKEKIEG